MASETEKLGEVVKLLAEVRLLLDGSYSYSSPVIRHELNGNRAILRERSDALSLVAELVLDIETVSGMLYSLMGQAEQLKVNTTELCGIDLELLARTYKTLAADISAAANHAVTALAPVAAATKGRRGRKSNATSTNQTIIPETALDAEVTP